MRRTVRGLSAALLVMVSVPVLTTTPAYAETVSESASTAGYFFKANKNKTTTDTQVGNLPVPVTQVDNVAAGDLAVAVSTPEGSDKESFFYFDLATVEPDAIVNKATLSLTLSESDGSEQIAPDAVKVQAAEPDDSGFGDVDAEDYAAKPAILPDGLKAPAKASADGKSYEFDVTAFASKWVTGENNGVAIIPTTTSSPFQVVFAPKDQAKLTVDYSPGAGEDDALDDVTDAVDDATGGAGTAEPDLGGGFDAGAPIDSGVVDSAPLDGGILPEITGADPAPQTAPEEPVAAGPARNVAAVAPPSITPDMRFWIGALLGALLLAFISLIIGDSRVAPASAAQSSRIGSALQERRRNGPLTLGTVRSA